MIKSDYGNELLKNTKNSASENVTRSQGTHGHSKKSGDKYNASFQANAMNENVSNQQPDVEANIL